MNIAVKAFEELLYNQLIPEFCDDHNRGCDRSSFKRASVKVSEHDAAFFLKAWAGGLIQHVGRGLYRSPRSAAGEQFFWSGRRSPQPRSFSLWLEPIITVAALAQLHFEFGWPKHLIGTQSVDWAFDLVAFPPKSENEIIAGEVKKTVAEVDQLLTYMEHFGQNPHLQAPPSGKARNAFKKVAALRARRAPVFWAVGPAGHSRAYHALYREGDVVELIAGRPEDLQYDARTCEPLHENDLPSYNDLRERVLARPILASDGNHSARVWRVAENVRDNARRGFSDDRLLHLISRVGVLCRTLASDLRSGHTSPEDTATVLEQLADLGDLSFEQWTQ